MFSAFARAITQIPDPRIRRVIWRSLGGTVAIYLVVMALLWWVLFSTELLTGLPGWETAIDWLGAVLVPVLALFLFPAVMSIFIGVFLDDVAEAVEARYYPNLPPAREQSIGEMLVTGLRFGGLAVLLNLLILPFILFGVGLIPFYLVNGYLLAREYFELAALRRMDPVTAAATRKANMVSLWVVGAIITVVATVPFVNILAPVIGTAAMVHMVNRLTSRRLASAL